MKEKEGYYFERVSFRTKGKGIVILNSVLVWVKQTHYCIQTHWKFGNTLLGCA